MTTPFTIAGLEYSKRPLDNRMGMSNASIPLDFWQHSGNEDLFKHTIQRLIASIAVSSKIQNATHFRVGSRTGTSIILYVEVGMYYPRVFVSGPLDLRLEEFDKHYRNQLMDYARKGCHFIMGSASGADQRAQHFLLFEANVKPSNITIYHKGDTPEFPVLHNDIRTRGQFCTHDEKDAMMTNDSDIDLAYIRSPEELKELYGNKFDPLRKSSTQKNIERRKTVY